MAIYYVGFPLLLLAAVFDATIRTLLRFWGGGPNRGVLVVVSWALVVDLREALPWAVMGGVFRDLLSVAPTGTSALALVIIVVSIDQLIPKLSWRNVILPLLSTALATIAYDVIALVILVIDGWPTPGLQTITYVIFPGLFVNLVLVLLVYRTVASINQFLRPTRASLL
ncbi:MAG: rod shape-determining protein MreD [Chloroflexi bacterium]|nr:rod shape-determining protein MreD [Chloroflexota bacterium]